MVMVHRGWRNLSNTRSRSSRSNSSSNDSVSKQASGLPNLKLKFQIQDQSTALVSESTVPVSVPATTSKANPNAIQEFAFVNVTEPGRTKDPEMRKLVRGHVVKDSTRKKRLLRQLNAERGEDSTSTSNSRPGDPSSSSSQHLHPDASPFAVPTQGLDPHPYLSPIIHHLISMGDAMYPFVSSFRFNPVSPAAWFDCALKDEALMHALLYTSSTYFGLLKGVTENKEAVLHGGRSIGIVKERLDGMSGMGVVVTEVVESTVRAVSCLAISECLRGNYEGWEVHMKGLKQMANLKGGVAGFSSTLQLKLHRADLMGASEYLVPAYFAEGNSLPKLPAQDLRKAGPRNSSILSFLNLLPISGDLCNRLIYMHGLSQSVSRILASPTVLSGSRQVSLLQHIYSLRYSLLPDYSSGEEFADGAARTLDEVLRVGALLYVSETPKEFPNAAVGPVKMVRRLRELVMQVQVWNEREAGLVLWLLFVGGIAARRGEDRMWFAVQVGNLTGKLGLERWGEVRERLEELWWVERIHEKACRELWDEFVVSKGVGVMNG
ncbi:hypothetical protein BKA65DRAFT_589439 [Rhexocercosporidium sp. MPI-PUGE-AT-0058]|nr:hypothetical protein BKA65DRAFT_589439 [Rhexocercosporidium sp. MPI-PUGE-AT-0058]